MSFHDVLSRVPRVNAAGALQDLSVHLCFICVLHLCNEHGLQLTGDINTLDRMDIRNIPAIPAASAALTA